MTKAMQAIVLICSVGLTQTFSSCSKPEQDIIKDDTEQSGKPTQPPVTSPSGRTFTLTPDAAGWLIIDNKNGTYKPGDVLYLKGNFKGVSVTNMSGAAGKPISFRNAPNTVTRVGNPAWNGGSGSMAMVFTHSHYIQIAGSKKSDFIIDGSTQPYRLSYFDINISEMSDNFEISNITIRNGGTGIVAKTSPVKGQPATQYPNSWLNNLSIHDVIVDGTINEGMYIGHTATYWNMVTNQTYFTLPAGAILGVDYAQPLKWRNVKIYNNLLKNIGADGLQTAAIDQLEIYNNEITNWGLQHYPEHSGGLLVGGRTTNTNVHDNHVHHGWGDMLQFFGNSEGNAKHVFRNNLFHDNFANEGCSFRGMDNVTFTFANNTIARPAGNCIRLNGIAGMKSAQIIEGNALIQPLAVGSFTVYPKNYIYLENGAQAKEGTGTLANTKIATLAAAGVDPNNLFQPLAGSAIGTSGYRAK